MSIEGLPRMSKPSNTPSKSSAEVTAYPSHPPEKHTSKISSIISNHLQVQRTSPNIVNSSNLDCRASTGDILDRPAHWGRSVHTVIFEFNIQKYAT